MKKKFICFLTLFILCSLVGCSAAPKEAVFLKSSVRYHFESEDMEESISLSFNKEQGDDVMLTGITDYAANVTVDPRYVIDNKTARQDGDSYTCNMQLPMFKNMKVSFSTISYQENQKEKTADIGIYEIEKSGKGIEEISVSKNWDREIRELYIDMNTEDAGALIKAEAANPDVNATFEIQEKRDADMGTDTRIIIRYELSKEYDMTATNFCYTFKKNGKEEQRYGRGIIQIYKSGVVNSGRGFQRAAV